MALGVPNFEELERELWSRVSEPVSLKKAAPPQARPYDHHEALRTSYQNSSADRELCSLLESLHIGAPQMILSHAASFSSQPVDYNLLGNFAQRRGAAYVMEHPALVLLICRAASDKGKTVYDICLDHPVFNELQGRQTANLKADNLGTTKEPRYNLPPYDLVEVALGYVRYYSRDRELLTSVEAMLNKVRDPIPSYPKQQNANTDPRDQHRLAS